MEPAPPTQEPSVRLRTEVRRSEEGVALREVDALWRGEVVLVDLILEVEQEFLERQVVPQWRAPLDLQLALSTPFVLPKAEGGWTFHGDAVGGEARLVVDRNLDGVLRLEDAVDGWRRYRWRRAVVVSGERFRLPTARLQVVWATRFEEDLVRGLVPLDRHEAVVEGGALDFAVSDIPLAGVPPGFLGAVGLFELEIVQEPSPATVDGLAGEVILLQISVTGTGALTAAQLPDLAGHAGIHVLGRRVETLEDGLRLHLELQATPDVLALPPISWAYFDPDGTAQFEILEWKALPIPGRVPQDPPTGSNEEEDGVHPEDEGGLLVQAALVGGGLLLLLLILRRSRGTPPADSTTAREKIAAPPIAVRASRPPEPKDLLDHLARVLACPRADVYAEGLSARLTETGLSEGLSQDLDRAVGRILAARYRGLGEIPSAAEEQSLVDRLAEEQRA